MPAASFADIYSCDSTVWASTPTLLIGKEADWQEGYILDTGSSTFRQVKENGERIISPETIEMTCSELSRPGGQRVISILCFDTYQDKTFGINTTLGDLPFAYTKMDYGGARLTYGTCTKV